MDTSKDIREKIKEEIKGAFKDGCSFADGYDSKVASTAEERTDSILEVIKEYIEEKKPSKAIFNDNYSVGINTALDQYEKILLDGLEKENGK